MIFFERLNISKIIVNHFSTFYNNQDNRKIDRLELAVYFSILLLLSVISAIFLPVTRMNVVLTPLTIFTGFLFSALFVIIDKKEGKTKQIKELISEVYDNISFSILMSFFIILFMIINYVMISFDVSELYNRIILGIVYFLLLNFSYSLMMVIKRLYKIFEN
ncbi:MAG: hypothetical protein BHW58_07650 [Azospirillum sp. 51_20]|jgi:hypothetical protein|nr:MAG: hypothetical protein BHW58_07650 [Azospirillum sp. 51_20]